MVENINNKDLGNIWEQKEKRELSVDEVLQRGVEAIYPNAEGLKELMLSRPINLYLGIDATSPYLHIGHTVPLRKLREFQKLGHNVTLLFGGFTSEIGDPSDKSSSRHKLTSEQVSFNMATYLQQAGKILDISPDAPNPLHVVNNKDWLAPLNFSQIVDLASNYSVQQIEERDMYKKRRLDNKPIWLHEFMYVLMQSYDAVHLNVDLEIGGNDQIFNMLAGQTLVRRLKDHEKWVLGMKLIMDTSGKKMGKSEGNALNVLDKPSWKMETMMLWPDRSIGQTLEELTSVDLPVVRNIQANLENIISGKSDINIMELKKATTYRVIQELDGVDAANFAIEEFDRVKKRKEMPLDIIEVRCEPGTTIKSALIASGLAKDLEDANTKIKGCSVYVDGCLVKENLDWKSEYQHLALGKNTIRNVRKIIV
jgi:tyrosyl-tRNA synthetase